MMTIRDDFVMVERPGEVSDASKVSSSQQADITKPWKLPKQQVYLFSNANVVDPVKGIVHKEQNVKIANGRIIFIKSRIASSDIHDAKVIDLKGTKYLSPGLIDSHVHLSSVPYGSTLVSSISATTADIQLRQPFICKAMLERGYTTVRDCAGGTLALKEAIAEGVFPGPRLFIAGKALSQTGGHGDKRGAREASNSSACCGSSDSGLGVVVDGVPSVLKAARDQFRQGADFIKLMVGGGVASPTDAIEHVQFLPEELKAASDVATSYGSYATAHAYTPSAIQRAIKNGVKGIEHGNLLDKSTAQMMADNGVCLTPTLITYHAMADQKYAGFLPEENAKKNVIVLEQGFEAIKIAHEAGVTMCLGSDLLSYLGQEQLGEFSLRKRILKDVDIMRQATINPAKMLKQEKNLGQIKEGYLADMLILNANPLEDVSIFEKPERYLLTVIKEGRVFSSRWSKMPQDVSPEAGLIE